MIKDQNTPTNTLVWKDVVGYEGLYKVSNTGVVRSMKRHVNLKPGLTKFNYHHVGLYKDGKTKTSRVHRIVGIAFIPNPENKPQINHIDGNKINNHVSNLEWNTASENLYHALATGLRPSSVGVLNGGAKLQEADVRDIRMFVKAGFSYLNISRVYPVCDQAISDIINGKTWSHV